MTRSSTRTAIAVVFIVSAFGVSVLCSWYDVGPDALSPRAVPGGGALLIGVVTGLLLTGAAWLLLRHWPAKRSPR